MLSQNPSKLEKIYITHYKKLLLIPLILLVVSLAILGIHYKNTGSFINKDVTLKGGVSATIYSPDIIDKQKIVSDIISAYPDYDVLTRDISDFSTGQNIGVTFEVSDIKADQLREIISKNIDFPLTSENYSVEEVGSSLGDSFFKEMIIAILFSLLFMSIVVFITFRKIVPSIAVMGSIILELVTTLAILSLFGTKISSAGIAALLMVMGYSIDTDILLTTRVLKRETGTLFERIKGAIKTGMTMTSTTIIAMTIGIIFTNSATLRQMFSIILIALIVDIIATWVMNTSLLVWYLDKRKKNENK